MKLKRKQRQENKGNDKNREWKTEEKKSSEKNFKLDMWSYSSRFKGSLFQAIKFAFSLKSVQSQNMFYDSLSVKEEKETALQDSLLNMKNEKKNFPLVKDNFCSCYSNKLVQQSLCLRKVSITTWCSQSYIHKMISCYMPINAA